MTEQWPGRAKWVWSRVKWLWHHVLGYFLHYIAVLSIGLIVVYVKAIRDDEKFTTYLNSAREWITPLAIAFLAVALFGLLIFAVRQNGELKQLRSHLAGFGVRVFSPHDSNEVRKHDWSQICNDLVFASRNQSPLWILCANGHRTFGHREAPLCAALRNYDGVINILLLKPGSEGFNRRVKNLKIDADEYRSEILDSINFCKELRKDGKSINVRLYHDLPIWKMIFTPKASKGRNSCCSFTLSSSSLTPIIIGTLGPYKSASRSPTRAPCSWRLTAKFTAVVLLPTPPLPLATAMIDVILTNALPII